MSLDKPESSSTASASQSHNSQSQNVQVMMKNRADVVKTIQEIAKVDSFTINQAIEACQDSEGRYSMDQVLNILMDENSIEQHNQQQQQQENENQAISNSMKKSNSNSSGGPLSYSSSNDKNDKSRPNISISEYAPTPPSLDIDEEDDDFEALNLQQGSTSFNHYSNSLISSSSGAPLKSESKFISESSLLREFGKPAGLKNVGNTCWFNSIIQAFFHLPCLRDLILSFQLTESEVYKLDEKSKNVVLFVIELRKLFALMLSSKRKTINPNPTLRCLRNCSKFDVELFNQEDVSEFATILVNLIEESFDIFDKLRETESQSQLKGANNLNTDTIIPIQISSSITTSEQTTEITEKVLNQISSSKNRKNPIVKLLNGDSLINRNKSDENVTTSLIEIFREVNIQMLNARSIHAGLELEWGETSIDKLIPSIPNSNTIKNVDEDQLNKSIYQQESWIVQLPAVLFICLNRYKFVKATQSSSKIMEPFEFEQHIYLDRYMYSNREEVKLKRKELKYLKKEQEKLVEKLNSIKCFEKEPAKASNNHQTYALDDVLKCVMNFATADHSLNEVFSNIVPKIDADETDPLLVKEREKIDLVKDCLQGWIFKIEDKIKQLEQSIKDIKNKLENIFNVDSLKKIRYNLHSVCIHEGNAISGHFWTYIWNTQQLKWYKFNDTEVSESNWTDLYSNAIGGTNVNMESLQEGKSNNQPSAYFLIYVKADDENLYKEKNPLDQYLLKLIAEDYQNLKTHIFNLRLKRLYADCNENLDKLNSLIADATSQPGANNIIDQNSQTCIEHAKAFRDSIIDCFTASFEKIVTNKNLNAAFDSDQAPPALTVESSGLQEALSFAIELELKKYNETSREVMSKLPDNDLRTNHILTYFSCNNVPREIRVIALYDLFRIQIFSENNSKLKLMQILAQIKFNEYVLASLRPEDNTSSKELANIYRLYEKWQNDYRDYRSIIAAFINAANLLEFQKYEEAATFFCVACEYNDRITNNLANKLKGMDHDFLLINRRKCLKLWNQSIIRKFTNSAMSNFNLDDSSSQPLNQQEMTALIELMISKFLPCFFRLCNANSTVEDKAMIDEIRQDWLAVLDSNLPELQVFHDFMAKLFEDQIMNHFHSLNVNKTSLTTRYKEAVQLLKKIRIN